VTNWPLEKKPFCGNENHLYFTAIVLEMILGELLGRQTNVPAKSAMARRTNPSPSGPEFAPRLDIREFPLCLLRGFIV
jgi:hypothetical protein